VNYLDFRNMLLSVAKDAYLNNCSKTTHYAQSYLLNCIIVDPSSKASGLLFVFIRVSTGHAHFPTDEIRSPWIPMRPSRLFFGCRMPERLTGKAGLDGCYARFSIGKETHLRSRAYLCVNVI